MKLEEAIKTAIEFEAQVIDVYRNAMEATSEPTGRRTFGLLANEEQHHLEYLKRKLDELKRTGAITVDMLETAIPSQEIIREGIRKLKAKMLKRDRETELQMLSMALDIENTTTSFYRNMVSELSGEGQKLFAHFVQIEEGHLAIVQAQIDYLSKTGYWFDIKEFDME